jgi:catechol 2,3-dioxygenase-like lactoylglutathione lyase family enzyme
MRDDGRDVQHTDRQICTGYRAAMRVLRIGYLGVRTSHPEAMKGFFRDVLGLEGAGESETVTFHQMPTHRHDYVEVYSSEHSDTRLIPDGADFVVAFVVDDIREAIGRVEAAGLEMVGEPVWAAEAFGDADLGDVAWFWVRAPDGRIYAIQQIPD